MPQTARRLQAVLRINAGDKPLLALSRKSRLGEDITMSSRRWQLIQHLPASSLAGADGPVNPDEARLRQKQDGIPVNREGSRLNLDRF